MSILSDKFPFGRAWGHWKLDGKLAVPCDDLLEWSLWFASHDRRVAETDLGVTWISTVFLGIDYSGRDQPMLFETMAFLSTDADGEHYCRRYPSWVEAEAGHAEAVEWAKKRITEIQNRLNQTGHPALRLVEKC